MAESFANSLKRSVGIVSTTGTTATIGAGSTLITDIQNADLNAGDLVVNQHFRAGVKIHSKVGVTSVYTDTASVNTAAASNQKVQFLGATTCYASPSATKSILIGGTFANLTENGINIWVEVSDNSASAGVNDTSLLASDIPIPAGSSFVISEAGKTVLEAQDEVRLYVDTDNAVDVSLAILKGVS